MTQKPITIQKLANLTINKKVDIDQDVPYSKGFENKSAERNVDPLRVIEIANTLELRL